MGDMTEARRLIQETARGRMSVASIIARGALLGTAAMSDPNVGSDLGSLACTAPRFETPEPTLKWLEGATSLGVATRAPDRVAIGFRGVL